MELPRHSPWSIGLVAVGLALSGCHAPRQIHDAEYAGLVNGMARAATSPAPVVEALPPVAGQFKGAQPVEAYVELALRQNPDIQAARKHVDALACRVPQAASLKDPMLGVTSYPATVQTAAGQQVLAMTASQQLPWRGKLDAQAGAAEAETNAARAQLAAMELEVIDQVKRAYYELYFIQKAIEITEQDRKLLLDLSRIAESMYRTGKASQQDVLRAQVEVSNLDGQLIRLRQQLDSGQATLARLVHVSPDAPLRPLDQIPAGQVPRDLDRLYQQAIRARPELHAQLASVQKDRCNVALARLQYFPDLTAGVTWIDTIDSGLSPVANGQDALLLAFSVNMPIYRQRLEAGVREAEAQAVSSVRRYDSLRDRTAEEVKDLYAQATSQYELVKLFREDIIPKAEQTLEVSRSAYEVGEVGFLQLIDNWQQLLKFQIAYRRLESQLQQSLAGLERVVGGQLQAGPGEGPGPAPAETKPPLPEPLPEVAPSAPAPPRPGNP